MLTDDDLGRIRDHAIANPSHAGDVVLRLVAEVERCRACVRDLFWRLEELKGRCVARRNNATREAGGGPCTEARALEDFIEELDEAIPGPKEANTP